MEISISCHAASKLVKHEANGDKQELTINADDYPNLKTFLTDCAQGAESPTTSVSVPDAYEGYELSLHCSGYGGDMIPAFATAFYGVTADMAEGCTILDAAVKTELDALAALIP